MLVDVPSLGGRPIINADTEIIGGVFIARNAIYVDFDENPEPYEQVYAQIDASLDETETTPLTVAHTVMDAVRQNLRFSSIATRTAYRREASDRGLDRLSMTDQIELSKFIGRGGVCTHQALLTGTMLRLLQDRRGLGGRVSIDPPDAPIPSHVWARYTHDGQKVAVDPAANYVKDLNDLPLSKWAAKYLRPEEKAKPFLERFASLQAA